MGYKYEIQEDWINPPIWIIIITKIFGLGLIVLGIYEIWNEENSFFKACSLIIIGVFLFFMAARNFRPIIGNKIKYIIIDSNKIKWRQGIMDTDKTISRMDITNAYIKNNKIFFETKKRQKFSIWLNQFHNKHKLDEFLAFFESELRMK